MIPVASRHEAAGEAVAPGVDLVLLVGLGEGCLGEADGADGLLQTGGELAIELIASSPYELPLRAASAASISTSIPSRMASIISSFSCHVGCVCGHLGGISSANERACRDLSFVS